MKTCSEFEEWAALFLYEELDAGEAESFETHVDSCDSCRQELSAMRQTLALMDQRSRKVPEEPFWEHFNDKLNREIAQGPQKRHAPRSKFWIYQGLAAAALVSLGILLGSFWSSPQPDQARPTQVAQTGIEAQFIAQANAYVNRSKTLLIGLVNMDVDPREQPLVDIGLHRKASRELIREAAYLRENYPEQAKLRLLELMDELEMIFLQISHLEQKVSVDGLEVIQEGVARGDLLLKINLEQLLPSIQEPTERQDVTL